MAGFQDAELRLQGADSKWLESEQTMLTVLNADAYTWSMGLERCGKGLGQCKFDY